MKNTFITILVLASICTAKAQVTMSKTQIEEGKKNDTVTVLSSVYGPVLIPVKSGTSLLYLSGMYNRKAGNQFVASSTLGIASGAFTIGAAFSPGISKYACYVGAGVTGILSVVYHFSGAANIAKAGKAMQRYTTENGVGLRILIQ